MTTFLTTAQREFLLSTCDAEGKAPVWAIKQIFEEHGYTAIDFSEEIADYTAHCRAIRKDWRSGKAILNWLGR